MLALDHDNADAEDLLGASGDHGEIRRLTMMFADLVDSPIVVDARAENRRQVTTNRRILIWTAADHPRLADREEGR